MIKLVIVLVLLVVSFVSGVLFGRRNKNKVEVALADAKAALAKVGIKS